MRFLMFFTVCFCSIGVMAQRAEFSESQQLGITAGMATSCGADREKIRDFELIAGRIIANKTPSFKAEQNELFVYATQKLNAQNKTYDCKDILKRFNALPIFKSKVYLDGTVILPDGTTLKPRAKPKASKNPIVRENPLIYPPEIKK